ncbi:hypothetical protein NKH77_13585 [Streptomyces sp. M19]
MSVEGDLHSAILGYNHSTEYLNTVLYWFEYYKSGTHEVPDATGVVPVGDDPKGGSSGGGSGSGHESGKDTTPARATARSPPLEARDRLPTPGRPPRDRLRAGARWRAGVDRHRGRGLRRVAPRAGQGRRGQGGQGRSCAVRDPRRDRHPLRGRGRPRLRPHARRRNRHRPKLVAGDKTGSFTVRATVVGADVPAADFRVTVEARPRPTPGPTRWSAPPTRS